MRTAMIIKEGKVCTLEMTYACILYKVTISKIQRKIISKNLRRPVSVPSEVINSKSKRRGQGSVSSNSLQTALKKM